MEALVSSLACLALEKLLKLNLKSAIQDELTYTIALYKVTYIVNLNTLISIIEIAATCYLTYVHKTKLFSSSVLSKFAIHAG